MKRKKKLAERIRDKPPVDLIDEFGAAAFAARAMGRSVDRLREQILKFYGVGRHLGAEYTIDISEREKRSAKWEELALILSPEVLKEITKVTGYLQVDSRPRSEPIKLPAGSKHPRKLV